MLLISSSSEIFAIFIQHLEVILEGVEVFSVPKTPKFICGIVNYRGRIITVIDLSMFLGLPETVLDEQARIVVFSTTTVQLGLLVGNVYDFLTIEEEKLLDPPQQTPGFQDERFISSVFEREGQLVSVLNTDSLIKNVVEMAL